MQSSIRIYRNITSEHKTAGDRKWQKSALWLFAILRHQQHDHNREKTTRPNDVIFNKLQLTHARAYRTGNETEKAQRDH